MSGTFAVIGMLILNDNLVLEATTYDGPFFAYIHNIRDDNTCRIVIIFASRDTADAWWRAISNATNSNGQSLNIQRVAPQIYTHDPDQRWNMLNFFTDPQVQPISSQFRGLMFFTLENDRGGRGISIIPMQTIVDHTSGSWFTVRSKSDPSKYWYYDPVTKTIVISSDHRTSFKISAIGLPDGTIMIGTDTITIWSEIGGFLSLKPNEPISLTQGTTPGVTTGPSNKFRFEDLKDGRFSVENSTLAYSETAGPSTWELAL